MDPPDYFKREVRIASQMSYPELELYIQGLRDAGFDVAQLTVGLYSKLSYPLVSLVMCILAIGVALLSGRRGVFHGVAIAILIGIGYWAAFEVFGKLGEIHRVSPLVAAWFPNLVFGLGGVWMLLKVRT